MTAPQRPSPGARRRETDERAAAAADRAAVLRALHRPGDPLVLPNVWDAASARAVEAAGFPAVATSSAAVAEVLGHSDGEATPVEEMLDAIARIVRAVSTPVTADLERGYGMAPAELVERLFATGAVGCNLEDSVPGTGTLVDAGRQTDFIAEIRDAAREAGVDVVLNARIDTFIHGTGTPAERLAEAIRRARLYVAAGADCVFPIFVTEPDAIRELVQQAGGPVNILFVPATPPLAELAALGVARVSFGAGTHRAVQAHLAGMLTRIASGADPYSRLEER
ncbi:isocitrate lyase/PEP mutase family protein [Actinomadura alba]|uniref:Isocitrate lyase/phosphoenolpyruvate mutase family protein n=1 Tax=Actinomadura alba TaxID=406431 RepID=A0ABR7LXN9_9ACTN|nr:isocitrate lyase/phosphoenolpyruvate mutase family protein [Actinomadura alba]MBC6469625.1 isocitrate lyase/phosphoenolpyruvate mutase family protein [Actinomadura alba]